MKLSLYQIEQEYLQIAESILANGGELDEQTQIALQLNKENLQTKAVNYGLVCKQLDADVSIINAEIDRLTALKKSRDKTIDKLKQSLSTAMQLYDVEKIESPILKISFRNSETIEIDNLAQIHKKFLVEKITVTPDKKKIKESIDAGQTVEGARIQQNKNIQIK